jgi:hypothetical protein
MEIKILGKVRERKWESIPQILPVERPQDTESPSRVIHLLQVEDCDRLLAYLQCIQDTLLQVHKVVMSGSVELEPTLYIREKVSTLQVPGK